MRRLAPCALVLLAACSREPADEGRLQAVLDGLRVELGAPGAILGVRTPDGRVQVVASGYADRETFRPMAPGDPYYLGSISKTYTAATVLRLAEEGRISLDETIDRYLPSFPHASKITARHLLAQTSGLKDFYTYLYFRPDREEMIELVTRDWTQEELLELAGRLGRSFDPGTDWDYSSTNYYLLGVLVERASGMSLPDAYRRYLFEPLDLGSTWLLEHEEARQSLPTGYLGPVSFWPHSEMFGELGATTVLDRSPVEWGAGGLAAPAEESIRFLRALLQGEILTSDSMAELSEFRPTPPLGIVEEGAAADEGSGYGLGLVRMERSGFEMVGHGGLFTGHTAGAWHLPDCDVTIALYFNRGFVGQRSVLDRVVPIVGRAPDGAVRCR